MLLGPTGVGKTSVIESVKRRCVACGARVAHATCLPVRDGRGYNFARTHWKLLTEALDDPFSDEHASPDAVGHRLRSGARRDGAASADEYRLGVLARLRECDLRAVVLDEAQHMVRTPSARSQADQLDVIKDSVYRTQVSHLLSGTYELAVMVAPSEQLARRSRVVHFPPYGHSEDSNQLAFQEVFRASCEKRVWPSFCLRPRGERGSADGTQRSQDDSDRHCGRGAGAAGVHGACLPVMRASTREEMRRISSTSRSSSRLFSIHSR